MFIVFVEAHLFPLKRASLPKMHAVSIFSAVSHSNSFIKHTVFLFFLVFSLNAGSQLGFQFFVASSHALRSLLIIICNTGSHCVMTESKKKKEEKKKEKKKRRGSSCSAERRI